MQPQTDFATHFARLKEKVFEKRPILAEIMQKQGQESLYELVENYIYEPQIAIPEERKQQAIGIIASEIKRLLGDEVAESAKRQLEKYYYLSTTDHHTFITHPSYINDNVLTMLPLIETPRPDLENIIVLSSGNISFDNFTFPRGLLLSTSTKDQTYHNQLVFYSRKVRPFSIFNHPGYGQEGIDMAKKRLEEWLRSGIINQKYVEKINIILDEIYTKPQMLKFSLASDQITVANYNLWQRFFPKKMPNLIFIEQGDIVNKLLLNYHLYSDTPINRILFDKKTRSLFQKHFNGISSAFSVEDKIGTFLFWGYPKNQKYRVQLWEKDGKLVTDDGSFEIELTPDAIAKAIQEKELFPVTALSFSLLNFYYGLRLIGGMSQTTYLTQMKEAYARMQEEIDAQTNIDYKNIETKTLAFNRSILVSLSSHDNSLVEATGIDLILYGNENTYSHILKQAKEITLQEAIDRVMPIIYHMFTREEEKEEMLASITQQDIEEHIGLSKKIKPFASLL